MRSLVYFLTGLLFISHDGYCQETTLTGMLEEITQATTGFLGSLPNAIPTPEQFFTLSKNAIIGLPYQVAYTLINQFCM